MGAHRRGRGFRARCANSPDSDSAIGTPGRTTREQSPAARSALGRMDFRGPSPICPLHAAQVVSRPIEGPRMRDCAHGTSRRHTEKTTSTYGQSAARARAEQPTSRGSLQLFGRHVRFARRSRRRENSQHEPGPLRPGVLVAPWTAQAPSSRPQHRNRSRVICREFERRPS